MPDSPVSQTTTMKWYNRLSYRIVLVWVFMCIFAMTALLKFINIDTRPALLNQSQRYIERVGNEAVYRLLNQTIAIESTAKALSVTVLKADNQLSTLISHLSANLAYQNNSDIWGGGYWTMPPHIIDDDTRTVFWRRNLLGILEYSSQDGSDNNYLQQAWFSAAIESKSRKCAWSKLYADSVTYTPKVTCAIAVRRSKNDLLGVVSVDMDLSGLDMFVQQTAESANGYVFLTDKQNNFISFFSALPINTDKKVHVLSNTKVSKYAEVNKNFLAVSNALSEVDHQLILKARVLLGERFSNLVNDLQSTATMRKSEAEMQAVALSGVLEQAAESGSSALTETVSLGHDILLEKAATAYLFTVPNTYWKMGIVLPDEKAASIADSLVEKLLLFSLVLILLIAMGSYYYLERNLLRPMRKTAQSMINIGSLVEQGDYKQLKNKQLSNRNNDEVGLVRESVNFLLQRIQENEEALVAVNQLLEIKVSLRTEELHNAMQRLQESQMQLVQSEKMSLLGQMVAGVAHEVNTPLAYIKNNVLMVEDLFTWYERLQMDTEQLITAYEEDNEPAFLDALSALINTSQGIKEKNVKNNVVSLVSDVIFGAEQIAELVVDLRVFSSTHETKTQLVDIHSLLEKSLKMARTGNDQYHVAKYFVDELPNIQASSSQMIQVFLNLLNNAGQVLEGVTNPTITITTRRVADTVQIEVADNGSGMDQETQKRVFEPFYTTKAAGKGTGLGLAICQQIIMRHHGNMTVRSMIGKGTTFVVTLPIHQQAAPQELPDTKLPML